MFDGTKQAEMLKSFSDGFNLSHDMKHFTVTIGGKQALYRAATPSTVRNNKLGTTTYRWEFTKPLGESNEPEFYWVVLHGIGEQINGEVLAEKIFVIPKTELEQRVEMYRGHRNKIYLNATQHTRPNKRTKFYFDFAVTPEGFMAFVQSVSG
jgi:hypothetical protein